MEKTATPDTAAHTTFDMRRRVVSLIQGIAFIAAAAFAHHVARDTYTRSAVVVIVPLRGTNVSRMMEQVVAADRAAKADPDRQWVVSAVALKASEMPTDTNSAWAVPHEVLPRRLGKCIVIGPAVTTDLHALGTNGQGVSCGGTKVRPLVVSASGTEARAIAAPRVDYVGPGNSEFAVSMGAVATGSGRDATQTARVIACYDHTRDSSVAIPKTYEEDLFSGLSAQLATLGKSKILTSIPYCEVWTRREGESCTLALVGSIGWFESAKARLPSCEFVLLGDGLSSHAAASHFLAKPAARPGADGPPVVYGFCPPKTTEGRHWFWGAAALLATQRAIAGEAPSQAQFDYTRLELRSKPGAGLTWLACK